MPDNEPLKKFHYLRDWWGARLDRWGWSASRRSRVFARHDQTIKIILLLGLSLAIAGLLVPHPQKPLSRYKLEAIAREDIRAVGDFLVEDVETTHQRRQELMAKMPPVVDLDEQVAPKSQERLQQAFEFMRQRRQEFLAARPPESRPAFSDLYQELLKSKEEFYRLLGVELPPSTFRLLAKSEFSSTLESLVAQVMEQVYRLGVVNQKGLPQPEPKALVVRRLPSRQ